MGETLPHPGPAVHSSDLDITNATLELYGYSRAELLGMTAFDLRRFDHEEVENLVAEFQRLVKAGRTFSVRASHYKTHNDTVDVEINAHSICAGDRGVLLVTVNDVIEQERMEKKITGAIIKTQEEERRNWVLICTTM